MWSSFHCLQFLFNFLKYSFLSSYSNNIFAIYLPGNFLLSNSHFFLLCFYSILTLLISSSPYFFLNPSTNFFMFSEISTSFQVYIPFRYFGFLLNVVYTFLFKIQKRHLGSPELSSFVLSKNMKNSKTIFSFSLYAMLLQVTQVVYFRLRTGDLKHGKPLEGSKVCYH